MVCNPSMTSKACQVTPRRVEPYLDIRQRLQRSANLSLASLPLAPASACSLLLLICATVQATLSWRCAGASRRAGTSLIRRFCPWEGFQQGLIADAARIRGHGVLESLTRLGDWAGQGPHNPSRALAHDVPCRRHNAAHPCYRQGRKAISQQQGSIFLHDSRAA